MYLIYLQNDTILTPLTNTKQYNILVDYLHYLPCVTYITRIRLRLRYK